MFIRNESFSEFVQSYKVVSTIVAINLILYVWTGLFGFLGGNVIRDLGVGSNLHIALGEYWRLVTPIFLHGSIMHVLFNSFSLVLFGPALERLLGKFRFIVAYLMTGIIANIVTFFLEDPIYFHLGASGAIYGLFGIYLYMILVRQDLIDQAHSQVIITILAIGIIMTFANPGINILAHLFGLISGAAIAPLILFNVSRYGRYRKSSDPTEITFDPQRWKKKEKNKQRLKYAAIIIGAILLLIILATAF